ncbi:MAG: M48 family metallopeptidase [Ruminococcaceae bacterium]|nr:M48 family metallopeptidase [Oscillospiraceae bacterium]
MTLKISVVAIALLGSLYTLILNIVGRRSANNPTPENLSDVYDAETYEKWKKYKAECSRLDIVFTVIGAVITAALLFTDLYAFFASLFGENMYAQIFGVVLLEAVVGALVGTLESYISNMIIEQKYGFNRTSVKTFVFDRIRSVLLGLALSCALVYLLMAIHMALGVWMILVFAAAVFAFTLLISFLYPILSRVGNKFVPLEEGELKDRLMELLTKHGYKVKAIEVMDASRRTTKLNAYFTGFGKLKTIVLYDNLVNAMTTDEICAVFAHELGHGLNKDVPKLQVMNFGNLVLMAVVAWLTVSISELYTVFGFEEVNYGFAYILMGVFLGLVQPITSMIMNAHSRSAEYRADRQAVKEGYGEAMITALKKLGKENFAHLAPSRLNVIMEYSHPPLSSRIEAIEREMKK